MHRWTRTAMMLVSVATGAAEVAAQPAIFDVHVHYSHDVWDQLNPEQAASRLRAAGITRALVSSSGDEGTQRLYRAAPDLVVPSLRPYRRRGELETWTGDDSVIAYLERRLAQYRYAAIGEFHLRGEEADLPVVRRVVQLAREHGLMLHAHADADAVERLFVHDPGARILWAHAGFEEAATVRDMLERYANLWADLSFRYDVFSGSSFKPGWQALLTEHSDRFMLGVDTYTPQRWQQITQVLDWYEALFAALPADAAARIRYRNAERVIASRFEPVNGERASP